MNTENYLEVTEVGEIKTASDNRRYQQLWMIAFKLLGGKRIYTNQPARSINVWEQGPPSAKGLTDFSKGDPLFNTVKVGDLVEGQIVTETVEQYESPSGGAPVSTYTMILFPHQNKITAFERAGHPIVDEDGVVHERAVVASRPTEAEAEKVEAQEDLGESF